jgi:hypothetical protein
VHAPFFFFMKRQLEDDDLGRAVLSGLLSLLSTPKVSHSLCCYTLCADQTPAFCAARRRFGLFFFSSLLFF